MLDTEFKVVTLAASDFSLPGRKAFTFPRSEEKVNAFMNWLQGQEAKGILEVGTMQQIGTPIETAWTNKYIKDSYQRGVQRARWEMKSAGYKVPPISETGGISASMSTPFHMDRVGVLYTRVFQELKGITSQMDTQISRVLSQGIADGKHPTELAKLLTRAISGPVGDLGITDTLGRFIPAERRAQTLARTEIIRAHHQGNIQEMKNWAVEGVKVKAEWVTAGYKVCPECAALEGKVYNLDEIQNKIPLHPNCRCCAIPVKAGEKKVGEFPKVPKAPKKARDFEKEFREIRESYERKVGKEGLAKAASLRIEMRKAKIRWVNSLPEEAYEEERKKILLHLIGNEKKYLKKIEAGTHWIPYDALETLKENGLEVTYKADVRSFYRASSEVITLSRRDSAQVIAHEFGHAIDDLVMNRKFDTSFSFKGTGFIGEGNEYVSKEQLDALRKEYKSLSSGIKGVFKNGDGAYWKNNWLDVYEGRIYKGSSGLGEEWWAMNCQRYQKYRAGLIKYDADLQRLKNDYMHSLKVRGEEHSFTKTMKKRYETLLQEGKEVWSARLSKWDKVRERYSELSQFVEESFSGRLMRKDLL